jgi:hypothetical protein
MINGVWRPIPIKIKAKNNTDSTFHLALFYFSRQYGIQVLANEPLPRGNDWVTLWGGSGKSSIFLPDNLDKAVDIFKLIISTDKVDHFLLEQANLQLGKIFPVPGFRDLKDVDTTVTDDWFTKTIRIKTVRQEKFITK